MLKKFLQAVAIPVKNESGAEVLVHFGLTLDNKPKVHEVSDEVLAHEHFKQYEDAGYVVDADQSPSAQLESLQQRNERLAAQLAKAGIAEEVPELAPAPAPVEEEAPSEEESESRKPKKKR